MVDSREVRPGDLFFGLRGERADGGEFAAPALEAGAWGVVVEPERARSLARAAPSAGGEGAAGCWRRPIRSPALQALARAWRRELGCPVVGITGSVGKTSVKDICHAILPLRVHASPENYNTEIGLPLAVLGAPPETQALVLEMAMRGRGQIAAAVRDRGAQRRGDHQHRPRPPGAARRPGGDRRGQGRDPRRARRARSRRGPRRRRGARAPPARPAGDDHLRRRRRRLRASVERRRALDRGHGRDAGRRAALLVPVRGGAQPHQRPGGDRDRRGARGAAGRDGAAGAGDNLLAPARRAGRAGRRNRRRERLLQRQPDLDARGARSPGLAPGARPPRRRARRDGGAGPERARLSPRGRGACAPARRRADRRGRRARPRLRPRRLGARCRGGGAARRGDARAGRRAAGQGLALGRPRARHRRADRRGAEPAQR